jgi:hypothetical protein
MISHIIHANFFNWRNEKVIKINAKFDLIELINPLTLAMHLSFSVTHPQKMIQLYIALAVLAICLYFKYKLSFWARKKIEGPAPLPIFGNLFDFVVTKKKHAGEIWRDVYK